MEPPKLVTFQTIAYLFEENRVLKAPPSVGVGSATQIPNATAFEQKVTVLC
jgi:hypothetical protein